MGWLAVAILLPTAVGYSVVAVRRMVRWHAGRRPAAPDPTLDRLGADLRRLRVQLEDAEAAYATPAKRLRCDALRAAYVDTLEKACAQLSVVPPAGANPARVRVEEIYRVEADLRSRGLDVRELAN